MLNYDLLKVNNGRLLLSNLPRTKQDIDELKSQATRLISLTTQSEMPLDIASLWGAGYAHLPITDMGVPNESFEAAFTKLFPELLQSLQKGETIALHCYAGKGRTGTIAARILIETGILPQAAIDYVRLHRKGAIETDGQISYLTSLQD